MKKQLYNVVEQLNASQGISKLSEDEIVTFKDVLARWTAFSSIPDEYRPVSTEETEPPPKPMR